MTIELTKQEADALLDLLDAAVRARGLSVAIYALVIAQKVKAAEAKAQSKPELVKADAS